MPETRRILCVDDEAYILNVIRRQLCEEDFEIHTALSGEEGLELLQQIQPVQIILSDYRMPGMNGIEFLRQATLVCPAAVVIMLSGFADVAAVKQLLESKQLSRLLRKPWRAEELIKTITEAAALTPAEGKQTPPLYK